MSSVMLAVKCNRCGHKTPEYWVTRDHKGFPSLDQAVCGECGGKNCVSRDWEDNVTHALIPPVEDGNINRFEYSFTDEKGKKRSGKMDPKMVEKHFKNNSGGLN